MASQQGQDGTFAQDQQHFTFSLSTLKLVLKFVEVEEPLEMKNGSSSAHVGYLRLGNT